jgi:hypothetical protein
MGTYIVVYLMGVKTRKVMVANMIEDFIAITIMVGRVSLQVVRGLIVGMFHFITREVVLNMPRWWVHDFSAIQETGSSVSESSLFCDLVVLWCDFWLAV